ncbi:MAG: hypothetical protein ACK5M0_08410 [Bacteroidales bacterium]
MNTKIKKIMEHIENHLNKNISEFDYVSVQRAEANTDVFLKQKLIELIDGEVVDESMLTARGYKESLHGKLKVKPDLVIHYDNEYTFFELKTCKKRNGVIPGSSIQQVDLLEPTILWDRESKEIKVGYYYEFLNGKIPFPDRSPRPNIQIHPINPVTYEEAKFLIEDWQEALAESWINGLDNPNTKWFDNSIDHFTKKLLDLDEDRKQEIIDMLNKK